FRIALAVRNLQFVIQMKLSAQWIRDFVAAPVEDRQLAEDLTSIGVAVEGISGEGASMVFEMEIGTNRPDAMNHYGVAREAAALYGVELKPLETSAAEAASSGASSGTAEAVPFPSEQPPKGEKGSATSTSRSFGSDFEIGIEDAEGCA